MNGLFLAKSNMTLSSHFDGLLAKNQKLKARTGLDLLPMNMIKLSLDSAQSLLKWLALVENKNEIEDARNYSLR